MKMTKIALAVAGLVAASQAFALTPAQITTARNNGTLQQAWISGASAPTRIVYEGFAAGCNPGTIDIYTTQSNTGTAGANVLPGSIGNYMAYSCSRGTGNVPSVLYHTLDGGSLLFVAPHSVGTKLARIQFPGNCTGANVGTRALVDSTNTQNNATVYKGCTQIGANLPAAGANPTFNAANAAAYLTDPLAPNLPAGGFSDVESALWPASIGGGDVSAFGTQSPAFVGQVFGVAVSIPLYRAMQARQGITESAGNFDPALAPTIDKNAYTSLIADGGTFADWSPLVGTAAATGKKVIIARRVTTSGTQASSTAFFLNNPCGTAVAANYNPLSATNTSTLEVAEGSSTGNVKTRITQATTAGDFAIGVVSAENDWRTEAVGGGSDGYRFIKIDGVHPEAGDTANARLTAVNNQYKFHMEMVNFIANTAVGTFGETIIQDITTKLGNPDASKCAVLPRGLTLNPIGGSSCAVGTVVAKMTNQGNNCAPALILP